MPDANIPPLEVVVRKRDKLVYKGLALAISSVNQKGPFDILPEHANFISVIKDFLIIQKPDKTQEKIELKNGVLYSVNNTVTVYLDILTEVAENVAENPPPPTDKKA
jgi:F0F1-type ATP synthase epsilon subunit